MEGIGAFLAAIAFCVYGVQLLTAGLSALSTGKLKQIITTTQATGFLSVPLGISINAIVGDAIPLFLVLGSLITSGISTLASTLAMITFADIGLIAPAYLMVFDIKGAVFIVVGIALFLHCTIKSYRWQAIVQTILGAALLLFGLQLLKASTSDLKAAPWFLDLLELSRGSLLWSCVAGLAVRILPQPSLMAILVARTALDTGIFDTLQLVAFFAVGHFGTVALFIGWAIALRGPLRQLMTVNILLYSFMGLFFTSLLAIEAFAGVPILSLLANAMGSSVDFRVTNYVVVQLALGITLFNCLRPWVLRLIEKIAPTQNLPFADGVRYLHPSGLRIPSIAIDFIKKEQLHLMMRLPVYCGIARENNDGQEALTAMREGFFAVDNAIEDYLRAFAREKNNFTVLPTITALYTIQQLLSILEKEVYAFCHYVVSHPERSEHTNVLLESIDFGLLQLVDAFSKGGEEIELLKVLTSDKQHHLDHLLERVMAATGDEPTRVGYFESIMCYDRITLTIRRLTAALEEESIQIARQTLARDRWLPVR